VQLVILYNRFIALQSKVTLKEPRRALPLFPHITGIAEPPRNSLRKYRHAFVCRRR
jgi:hypothetical protein